MAEGYRCGPHAGNSKLPRTWPVACHSSRVRFQLGSRDREILALAVPALGALIAEPLYVLADTAVVGNIGTEQLGGLSLATQIILIALALCIFLAYGTTAAVSRLIGAGQHDAAARQAIQSLWLAFGVGVAFAIAMFAFADPLLRLVQAKGAVLAEGKIYLRVSTFGIPAMLLMLAGVGYLRGLKDTKRPLVVALLTAAGNLVLEVVLIFGLGFGIGASALSTVVFQWVGAAMYLRWIAADVVSRGISIGPDLAVIRRLAVTGVDLFIRTAALRASFGVAAAVSASLGDVDLAANEIAFALWMFVALALDSVAIAGQALVGNFLGSGDTGEARAVSRRIIEWAVGLGVLALVLIIALRPWLPNVFSDDQDVVALAGFLLWFVAAMQPLNGLVFALDGILIGAGDLRFLAFAMPFAAAVFIPLAIAVALTNAGIGWLYAAIVLMMAVRASFLVVRFRGDRWLVTGAPT